MSCDKTLILLREQSDCVELYEAYEKYTALVYRKWESKNMLEKCENASKCYSLVDKIEILELKVGYSEVWSDSAMEIISIHVLVDAKHVGECEHMLTEFNTKTATLKRYIEALNGKIKELNK